MIIHAAKVAFSVLYQMKTVSEARIWLKQKLKNIYDADELAEIQFLVLHKITGLSQTQLHVFNEKELTETQIQMLLLSVKKLESKMPVQYVLGEADFFGMKFKVNSAVLIPRPETEELVAWVLETQKNASKDHHETTAKILDIGTGSGCIPIAIKKNWPEAEVSGLDIAAEALQIARENALLNQVEVVFFQQDILNFEPIKEASKYNIIISNPPYITPPEKLQMHQNVLAFEPHQALFVPQENPLIFYAAIAGHASFMLQKNGLLFFEINENFGQEMLALLTEKGFINLKLKKDFRGKDRMICAQKH